MYNILVFDNRTMKYSLIYMCNNIKTIIRMYNYYRKIFSPDTYIMVNQTIQTNQQEIYYQVLNQKYDLVKKKQHCIE